MKKNILLFAGLLAALSLSAQGIAFETGSWKQVLEKAAATGKPVFVDVYTSWCGPCKAMSRDVFPQEKVGTFFNDRFVCAKVNAEEGEGVDLARLYNVHSYPTYLFVKADGTLFARFVGSMPAELFLSKTKDALKELSVTKTMADWEAEYAKNPTDTAFLKAYMARRAQLEMDNSALLDQYLSLLPVPEVLTSRNVLELVLNNYQGLKVGSLTHSILSDNRAKLLENWGVVVNELLDQCLNQSMNQAIRDKDRALLDTVMGVCRRSQVQPFVDPDQMLMLYGEKTGNLPLADSARWCFGASLMAWTPERLDALDARNLEGLDRTLAMGIYQVADSSQMALYRKGQEHALKNRVAYSLNDMAWTIFGRFMDKKALRTALTWSERSLLLDPESVQSQDTQANLLYKLGKKKEAIKLEEVLLASMSMNDNRFKSFSETLRKMKAGEKTW